MEENKQEPEVVETDDEVVTEEDTSKPKMVKKTAFDYNLSWVVIILLAGIAIFIGQSNVSETANYITGNNGSVIYILLEVILSLIIGILSYNAGKIAFGYLSGYRLLYVQLFGVKISRVEKKFKFQPPFSIWNVFDFKLVMIPKKENPSPLLMCLGGVIVTVVIQAIFVILGIALNGPTASAHLFNLSTLYGIGYVGLVVIYELIPVRLDNYNDGFLLLKTKNVEDRLAHNITLLNKERDELKEPVLVHEFNDYNSYAKANYLYYIYLNHLYNDELQKAVETLNTATYLTPYMFFDNVVKIKGESLYVLLVAGEVEAADKTFRSYSHEERSEMEKPKTLSDFRIALLVFGAIETEFERTLQVIKNYEKYLKTCPSTPRVEKETYLFDLALTKIKAIHPEWNFDVVQTKEHDIEIEEEYEEEDE